METNGMLIAALLAAFEGNVVSSQAIIDAFVTLFKTTMSLGDDVRKAAQLEVKRTYWVGGIAQELSNIPAWRGKTWKELTDEASRIVNLKGSGAKVAEDKRRTDEQETLYKRVSRYCNLICDNPIYGLASEEQFLAKLSEQQDRSIKARETNAAKAQKAADETAQRIVMGAVYSAPKLVTSFDALQFATAERNRISAILTTELHTLNLQAYNAFKLCLDALNTLPTVDEVKAAEQKAAKEQAEMDKAEAIKAATVKAAEQKAAEQKAAEIELATRIAASEASKAAFAAQKAAEQKAATKAKVGKSRRVRK